MIPHPAAFDGYPPFTPPALVVLLYGYMLWILHWLWMYLQVLPLHAFGEVRAAVAVLLPTFGLIDALLAAWLLTDLLRWFTSARPRPKVPLVLDLFALLNVGMIQLGLTTLGAR